MPSTVATGLFSASCASPEHLQREASSLLDSIEEHLQREALERKAQIEGVEAHIGQLSRAGGRVPMIERRLSVLEEEGRALRQCLVASGVLDDQHFLRRAHRRAFAAVQRLHPRGDVPVASLADVIATPEMINHLTTAGLKSLCRAAAAGRATDAIRQRLSQVCAARLCVTGGVDMSHDALATAECLDPVSNAWQPLPSMANRRYSHAAAALGGSVFVCGGVNEREEMLRTVERLDLGATSWQLCAPMVERRSELCAAAAAGILYAIGGTGPFECLASVERLAPDEGNVWIATSHLRCCRQQAASAALGGRLYICGGLGADGGALRSAEVSCPTLRTGSEHSADWRDLPAMAAARSGAAAVAVRARVIIIGGESDGVLVGNSEVFDPAEGTWAALAGLPSPRHNLVAANVGGRVLAFGGADSQGEVSACFDTLCLASAQWSQLSCVMHCPRRAAVGAVARGGQHELESGESPFLLSI